MMGYNLTIGPIRRMMPHLRAMLERQENIQIATSEPRSLAYRIREAIKACAEHDRYKEYARLEEMYEIRTRKGYVVCHFVGPKTRLVEEETGEEAAETTDAPKMRVEEVKDLPGVIGATINFGNKTPELYFPNVILKREELERLFVWSKEAEANWKIIHHEEEGITMTRKDIPRDVAWTPREQS